MTIPLEANMARCPKCGCKNGEHIIDCPNNPDKDAWE